MWQIRPERHFVPSDGITGSSSAPRSGPNPPVWRSLATLGRSHGPPVRRSSRVCLGADEKKNTASTLMKSGFDQADEHVRVTALLHYDSKVVGQTVTVHFGP